MKTKIDLHSIKSKMIVCITSLTLLVCAGLSLITLYFANSSFPQTVNSSLLQIAKEGAQIVTAQVEGYYSKLNTLSAGSIFQDQVKNKEQIDILLDKMAKEWGYKEVFLSDVSGQVAKNGLNISSQDYFKNALSGKANITDPLLDNADKSVSIYVAVPVKDNSGAVIGVLAAKLDGNALSQATNTIKYGKTGSAYMINSKGTSIAHYNKDSVLTLANVIEQAKKDAALSELAGIQTKMINGQEGISQYMYKDMIKYVAYCQVGNGTGWSIGLAVEKNEIFADVYGLTRVLAIACVIFLILSVLIAVLFAGKISRQLKGAVTLSNKMAEGDFSFEIREQTLNRKDELGLLANSFFKINNNLNDILSTIKASADQVYTGSVQISDSSTMLSQGATEQASSIEELSASIEQISAQTNTNANSAKDADQIARDACQKAETGSAHMTELLDAMNEIYTSSRNISKIIKVIDDIAFQTNILSLNAAVEAARAGQHGKGFAVVAEEVRNLAARSASAAKDTTELIEGSVKKVEQGSKIAKETSDALQSIVKGTRNVASLVKDIASASGEQASGIEQISQGIAQVSAVVQSNSAISEETAASSEEMSAQAKMLFEQIEMFKLKGKASENPADSGEQGFPKPIES